MHDVMPDLADLRAVVRSQTLAESDDVSDVMLHLFLNQALRKLSSLFRWPWLESTATISTVSSTPSYALPSDLRKLFVIRDDDARRTLTRLTLEQALEKWGGDPPEGDYASWYYTWDDAVYLLPIPNATEADAYTIFYQAKPTILSTDTDEPAFAEEFHLILTSYAEARVWEHEEEFEKAATKDAQFMQDVNAMARHYLKQNSDYPFIYGDGPRPNLTRNQNMPFLDGA